MVLPPHLAQASARAPRPSVGKSLPLLTTGEHDAICGLSGTFGIAFPSLLRALQEHGGGVYMSTVPRPLVWVVGTRAHVIWGVNTNIFPSPSQLNGGGGVFPNGSDYYAVGRGDSILSHPTAIVEWAACASADAISEYAHKIISYWDANASPREGTLCWEKNAGPPLYSRRSMKERLLANAQSEVRRAQWVCTYLAMFVSPLHTFTRGGGTGPNPHLP